MCLHVCHVLTYMCCFVVKLNIGHSPINMPVGCQYRACTGPMLPAWDQYRPGTGTYRHVYRERVISIPYQYIFPIFNVSIEEKTKYIYMESDK